MTTIQFAQRLLRYLTVKDVALLPGEDALHLLDAINSGIQQFYALAPSIYKQTTLSGTLRKSKTVTLGVTKDSPVFTTYTAPATEKGYTIIIDGDPRQNEIVASNGLLDDYTGDTGTRTATIYGDCLPLNTVIDRLVGQPILDTGETLEKEDQYREWGGLAWGKPSGLNRQVGKPRRYWIEGVGQSQAGDPAFLLRVDTLPDRDYRVRIDAELAPRKVTFSDLETSTALPVDTALVESHLLPICAGELTFSPLWQDASIKLDVQKRAQQALQMTTMLHPSISLPSNRVGTPRGF